MIFHIVNKDKWNLDKTSNFYTTHSLEREGYIHCSFNSQLMKVADSFHKGQTDLVVLCIDENKLGDKYKVEDLFNLSEKYPHVYGEIPINTIDKVVELCVDDNGNFIEPDLDPIASLFVKQKEWT